MQHTRRAFFFDAAATTDIYTLSLHDALPISRAGYHGTYRAHTSIGLEAPALVDDRLARALRQPGEQAAERSEEHTSELQSRGHLVCRLLLEKKKVDLDVIRSQRQNNPSLYH